MKSRCRSRLFKIALENVRHVVSRNTRKGQLIGSINKLSGGMGTRDGWLPTFSLGSFIPKATMSPGKANPSPSPVARPMLLPLFSVPSSQQDNI